MAHIQVPDGAPGILGPMAISPESTKKEVKSGS
jgi:hypothetical protein